MALARHEDGIKVFRCERCARRISRKEAQERGYGGTLAVAGWVPGARDKRLVIAFVLLALARAVGAQTIALPSQNKTGVLANAQTTTGPSTAGVDTRAGFQTAVFTYLLAAGTATVQTEINCELVSNGQAAAANWALVANSSVSLTAGSNIASIGLTYPDCSYRTNVTACSGCTVTTKYKLGAQLR